MHEPTHSIGRASALMVCPACQRVTADRGLDDSHSNCCERCGAPLPPVESRPRPVPCASPAVTPSPYPAPSLWQRVRNRRPWGFWATTAIAFSTILIHVAVGIVIVIAALVAMPVTHPEGDVEAFVGKLEHNGLFLAVTSIVVSVLTCAWLHLSTWLRRVPWREYFALRMPSVGTMFLWLVILLAWLVLEEAYTTYCLVDTKTSLFMTNIYETAGFMPLFVLGVVVAAPLAEEWLFRGFMYQGYARSPVGVVGAIGIPSILWAMMHLQYDWGFIGVIFAMGLLFGAARYVTGTIVVPIFMHMVCNGLATLQVAYDIHLFPLSAA